MVRKGTAKHDPEYLQNLELRALQKTVGSQEILIPHDIIPKVYKAAIDLPTYADIAATLGIHETTLAKWRKENPDIETAINKARSRKTKTMINVVEKEAKEGNLTAVSMWMRYFRKDLSEEQRGIATTNLNLQLNIIPPAADTKDWLKQRDEQIIIQQSDELKDATPLFKGRF